MIRRWLPLALLTVGTLLVGSVLLELLLRLSESAALSESFVAGAITSVPFALALVAGGYSLTRGAVPADYFSHIAVGTLAGIAFFLVFFGVIAVALFETWIEQVGVLRWALAVGAGNGFLISFLYTRGVSHDVALERTTVKAEEARRQQQLLEYLNALLRHEVLNTATAIKAHADLADETADDESVRERISVIKRQTDGLTEVIDDVQLLLTATEQQTELEPIDLDVLVREELRRLREKHPGVETDTELPEGLSVQGDDLLGRIFSNLFENAVEHNDSDHPRVSVTASRSEETIAIHIEDNGPGFPADDLDTLSEPLEDMNASHGLGLTIVSRLAERYGGTIELTRTGPGGSVVTVELPRVEPPSQ